MSDETLEEREKRILDYFTKKKTIPAGYKRAAIILEDKFLSATTKGTSILGHKTFTESLELAKVVSRDGTPVGPPGTLPEGIFFAKGTTPRILVENGRMVAVELLQEIGYH